MTTKQRQWRISKESSAHMQGTVIVSADGTTEIAGVWKESDAQLIVRAVNCHDDLLAACKAYLYGQKDDRECEALMRDAIALAEGRPQ